MSSKSIVIISSYTISELVHFFETQCMWKKSVYGRNLWFSYEKKNRIMRDVHGNNCCSYKN